ncbi:hypothetical protein QN363_20885, partial [Undibacterium sp. CCC2.1]
VRQRDSGQFQNCVFEICAFQGDVHQAQHLQWEGPGNQIIFYAVHFKEVCPFKEYAPAGFDFRRRDQVSTAADKQYMV